MLDLINRDIVELCLSVSLRAFSLFKHRHENLRLIPVTLTHNTAIMVKYTCKLKIHSSEFSLTMVITIPEMPGISERLSD